MLKARVIAIALSLFVQTVLIASPQTASPVAPPGEQRKTSEPYTGDLSIFDSPGREDRLQINRVMDILGIAPGKAVADIGAGSGWFTVRAAKRVSGSGPGIRGRHQSRGDPLRRRPRAQGAVTKCEDDPWAGRQPAAARQVGRCRLIAQDLPRSCAARRFASESARSPAARRQGGSDRSKRQRQRTMESAATS